MNTNIMAMGISVTVVLGAILSLGGVNLIIGSLSSLFGRPKLTFLKSSRGKNGFGFLYEWAPSLGPAVYNRIRIRLFNPFGTPTQLEITKEFDGKSSSFVEDIDMGPTFSAMLASSGLDAATMQVELVSTENGFGQQFEMRGADFKRKLSESARSAEEVKKEFAKAEEREGKTHHEYGVVPKDMVADTVPGKGAVLKLATNPLFAGGFTDASGHAPAGGAAAAGAEVKKENFKIEKVWIAPGCIVCNACEDIYPEVFDVQANTCLIRPNPPLNDGLKIQEAAEACPVEVIKYTKAAT